MPRGGARIGAGRKPQVGDEVRKNCTLKATEAEWKLILDFARIVKHGNKQAAIDFVNQHKR